MTEDNPELEETEMLPEEECYEGTEEEDGAIYVPIEELGTGLFNALGDMVGGAVALTNTTSHTLQKGAQTLKEKVAQLRNKKPTEQEGELLDMEESYEYELEPTSEEKS
ncbi:MAG: hypothetical protein HQL67_06725 [Magnetococcales bacterium]|nr:hypothetical protein [Magnetococcales bacterium]